MFNDIPHFSEYTCQSEETIAQYYQVDIKTGLSSEQIKNNQKKYGLNSIPITQLRWWHILWKQCSSIFVLIFISLGIVSLLLGELTNALIILSCVSINLSFGFYQEYKTSQALALLKKYLISYVKVKRNGTDITIPSEQLVVGDLLIIGNGDRLFVDVRIIQDNNLMIDESILTGESNPVPKTAATIKNTKVTLYDAHNIGFTGTTIVHGTGLGIVFAIGQNTTLYSIAKPTTQEDIEKSSIITTTQQLGIFLITLIFITLGLVLSIHFFIKGAIRNYIDMFIFASALAISIIPEGLPVVVTFCLSSGATALAKKNVLVKRLSALEDLGTVEVLCTDKTGTLTENKVTLANIYATTTTHDVIEKAALAMEFIDKNRFKTTSSKGFDTAIHDSLTSEQIQLIDTYQRLQELPYDPKRKLNSVLVRDQQSPLMLIVRGLPEDITPLCNQTDQDTLNTWIAAENSLGHRIVAIAIKSMPNDEQSIPDLHAYEHNLLFIGMLSFNDPLKPTSITAIKKSKQLGLQIKVISGDSVAVCYSIGQQIGLITTSDEVITGEQFAALNTDQKIQAVTHYSVFARCLPTHKLSIIQTLQYKYIVAYLGEGINDIPALKMANVSLVVQEAADIARDTADIILLEKSLLVIIDGIEEGRKIIINTLKYVNTTLIDNVGNLYAIAGISLFINYLPILPIHILLINLLTDLPFLAISTDSVDNRTLQVLQHFSVRHMITFILPMGILSNIFDLITFGIFHNTSPEIVQMAWYTENMLTEILLIFSLRTSSVFYKAQRPSTPLIVLSFVAWFIAIAPFYTTIGQKILILPPLSAQHFTWVIGIALAYFITVEVVKYYYYTLGEKSS